MSKQKILICEDEQDILESLKNILSKRDYEVYTALDGQEAIDKTAEFKPDLLISDIRMPKIDGLELAREIRKTNKDVKIVFITGFRSPEIEKEAKQYGIDEYLVKPISAEAIVEIIEKLL